MTKQLEKLLEEDAKAILLDEEKVMDLDSDDSDDMGDEDEDAKKESSCSMKKEAAPMKKRISMKKEAVEDDCDDEDEDKMDDDKKAMKEHVDALLVGAESLSEDFKTKATTIFESAVAERVSAATEILEARANELLEEHIAEAVSELEDKADQYLTTIAEQWLEENKLAVETGLKLQLAEDFINDLRSLFEKHDIVLPESSVDIAEQYQVENRELEVQLDEAVSKVVSLKSEVFGLQKQIATRDLSEGLALTQQEKLKALVEGVEAKDIEEFTAKAKTLKESYNFGEKQDEQADPLKEEAEVQPTTSGKKYAKYLYSQSK